MLLHSLRTARFHCCCAAGEGPQGLSGSPNPVPSSSNAGSSTSTNLAPTTRRVRSRSPSSKDTSRNWVTAADRSHRRQQRLTRGAEKTLQRRLSDVGSSGASPLSSYFEGAPEQRSWEEAARLDALMARTLRKQQHLRTSNLKSLDVVVDRLEVLARELGMSMDQAARMSRLEGRILLEPTSVLESKLQLLESLLGGISRDDVLLIVESCPKLLMRTVSTLSVTLKDISALFKSRGLPLADIAMQRPDLLLQDAVSLRHKLDALPKAVELSSGNAMDIVARCPGILRRSTAAVQERFLLLRDLCNLPQNFLSELIFQEPEVLCFSPSTLAAKFEALMKKYGSFQADVVDMILVEPRVLIEAQPLQAGAQQSLSSWGSLDSMDEFTAYGDSTRSRASLSSMEGMGRGGGPADYLLRDESPGRGSRNAGRKGMGSTQGRMRGSMPQQLRRANSYAAEGFTMDGRVRQQGSASASMGSMGSMSSMSSMDGASYMGMSSPWFSPLLRAPPAVERKQRTSIVDHLLDLSSELDAPLAEVVDLMKAFAQSQGRAPKIISNRDRSSCSSSSRSSNQEKAISTASVVGLSRQVKAISQILGVSSPEGRRIATAAPVLLKLSKTELHSRVQSLSAVLESQAAASRSRAMPGAAAGRRSPPSDSEDAQVPAAMASVLAVHPELLVMDSKAISAALQHLQSQLSIGESEAYAIAAAHPVLLLQLWQDRQELPSKLAALQKSLDLPLGVITELMVKEPRLMLVSASRLQAGLDKLSGGFSNFGSADAMDIVMADPTMLLRAADPRLLGGEGSKLDASEPLSDAPARPKVKASRRKREKAAAAAAAASQKLESQAEAQQRSGGKHKKKSGSPDPFPSQGLFGGADLPMQAT